MNKSNFYFSTILLIITLFSFQSNGFSQSIEIPLSVSDSAKEYKTKFVFSIDSRRSFLFGQTTKLNGFKLGLQFKKKHKLGISIYSLKKPIILRNISNTPYDASFDFGYGALFYEYVFFSNDKWELGFPIHFGAGDVKTKFLDSLGVEILNPDGTTIDNYNFPFYAMELSFTPEYKIFKWFGIGAGLGYRKVWSKEKMIEKVTSGPVYTLKLKIYIGVIYRGIKNKFKSKE